MFAGAGPPLAPPEPIPPPENEAPPINESPQAAPNPPQPDLAAILLALQQQMHNMEEQLHAIQATTMANTIQLTLQNQPPQALAPPQSQAHIPVAPQSHAQPVQAAESVHNSNVGNQPQEEMPA